MSSCMACMVAGEKSKLPWVRRKPGPRPPRHIDPPARRTLPLRTPPTLLAAAKRLLLPRLASCSPPSYLASSSASPLPRRLPTSLPPPRVLHAARHRRSRLRQAQICCPRYVRVRLPVRADPSGDERLTDPDAPRFASAAWRTEREAGA